MSQYLPLSARNVEFILELFDAGATLHQILEAFYKNGQAGVQFVTIQRCLIEHGRVLPCTDTIQHTIPATSSSTQQPYGNPSSSSLTRPSPGQIASSFNPITQLAATAITPTSAPIYSWNAQADTFTLSAYRYGQTVSQITIQLRNNGYDNVTHEEVIASLFRQGVRPPNSY